MLCVDQALENFGSDLPVKVPQLMLPRHLQRHWKAPMLFNKKIEP